MVNEISNYKRKDSLKKSLKALVDFRNQRRMQPPVGGSLVYSVYDTKTVLMYYRLRRFLRNTIKEKGKIRKTINKLPVAVWLLRKYVYECVLIVFSIILFYFYMVELPNFRGKLALFNGLFFTLWFLTRVAIKDIDKNISLIISELIELIKDELKVIPR